MLTKEFLQLSAYARRASRRLEVLGRVNSPSAGYLGACYLLADAERRDGREVYCTSRDDAVAIQCLLANAEAMYSHMKRSKTNRRASMPPRLVRRHKRQKGIVFGGLR